MISDENISNKGKKRFHGLLWHIDNFEESFLLTSKNNILTQIVEKLIELHIQKYPFIHTIHSKQQHRYLDSIKRQKYNDNDNIHKKTNSINMNISNITNINRNIDDNGNHNNANIHVEAVSIWENYSLETAVNDIKDTTLPGTGTAPLMHVQYKIIPVLPKVFAGNNFELHNSPTSTSHDSIHSFPSSSSSSTPTSSAYNLEAEAIFSSKNLKNLELLYDTSWPINSIISAAVLNVTVKITRRLLHFAQLNALIKFVWKDMRGRKNNSLNLNSNFFDLDKKGGSNNENNQNSSSNFLFSNLDKDCSHAIRIIQQTLQPLQDFTADRMRIKQLKFKKNLINFSNHGLSGLNQAIMCYVESIILSIYADEDNEANLKDMNEKHHDNNNIDKKEKKNESELNEEKNDLSVSELISILLEVCFETLKIIQLYSIEWIYINRNNFKNNFSEIYVDIMRKEGIEIDIIKEKKKQDDIELVKISQLENHVSIKIKTNIEKLLHYRNNLFSKIRKIVYDDNQEDAIALLMYFNQS